MKDKVQSSVITKRAKEIRNISNDLKNKHMQSLLNTDQNVLWENKNSLSGYTENYTYFSLSKSTNKKPTLPITKVKVKSIEDDNLVGIISI